MMKKGGVVMEVLNTLCPRLETSSKATENAVQRPRIAIGNSYT